jgi:hypothetical protein
VLVQGICVPFVVVGHIVEPRVTFSKASIKFEQILVGRRGREKVELVNNEHIPFDFVFDKATYDATDDIVEGSGRPPVVNFDPWRGTVGPNSTLTIAATYKPDRESMVNYTMVCHVKKKPTHLTLNVKGEGYAVHESLNLVAPDGKEVPLSASVRDHFMIVMSCKCFPVGQRRERQGSSTSDYESACTSADPSRSHPVAQHVQCLAFGPNLTLDSARGSTCTATTPSVSMHQGHAWTTSVRLNAEPQHSGFWASHHQRQVRPRFFRGQHGTHPCRIRMEHRRRSATVNQSAKGPRRCR